MNLELLETLDVTKGYGIVDGFFFPEVALELLHELRELQSSGLMLPNQVEFLVGDGNRLVATKPGIFEADMFDSRFRDFPPMKRFRELFYSDELSQNLPDNHLLKHSPQDRVLKLQFNDGTGGCFPWHYDNPGAPNKRALTCCVYLNNDWKEGHGGELLLQPFLGHEVVIPPLFNRLVVFKSDSMLHRVLPASHERYCFTLWVDGHHVNLPEHSAVDLSRVDIRAISMSPSQRIFARAVYDLEFEESLRSCMSGNEIMIEQHRMHVEKLHPSLKKLVEVLKSLKGQIYDHDV